MEYKFTADNFQQEVLNSSQPVMVDFFANWCGPCQMMGPVIANLAEEYAGKIKIGKINVDENPGVAQTYDVATIPNLVFFKDGKVVNRVIGVVPDNVLKEKLDALLREGAAPEEDSHEKLFLYDTGNLCPSDYLQPGRWQIA